MVRAGAGDKHAAGIQKLQGPKIYLFVTSRARLDRGATLGKGGRVKHYRIEALACRFHSSQYVKNIPNFKSNVAEVVQLRVSFGSSYSLARDINSQNGVAYRSQMQSK